MATIAAMAVHAAGASPPIRLGPNGRRRVRWIGVREALTVARATACVTDMPKVKSFDSPAEAAGPQVAGDWCVW